MNASISQEGDIVCTLCTVNGNAVLTAATQYNPFYAAGRVAANGTKVTDTGRVGYTIVKRSGYPQGLYDITFNTAYPNNNYVYTITPIGAFVYVTMGAETSKTTISVYTYTGSGTFADCSLFFTVF